MAGSLGKKELIPTYLVAWDLQLTFSLFVAVWSVFRCLLSSTCSIYVVTVSSRVIGGSSETLCAQVHGPTECVSLSVTLNTDSCSITVLEETRITTDFYRCVSFQVWFKDVYTHCIWWSEVEMGVGSSGVDWSRAEQKHFAAKQTLVPTFSELTILPGTGILCWLNCNCKEDQRTLRC